MEKDNQSKRLKVYTAVLLSVNDLFFDAVEETTDWSRSRVLQEQEL